MREITREKRYIQGSKRSIPENKRQRGTPVHPSEAMTTVRGSRVHLKGKPSGKLVSKLNTFALCGAGAPNREFPTGSSQFFERGDNYQEKKQWVIVDCYKCIKLEYANRMIDQGFGKDIPERKFAPSNQHPTHWGYEANVKEITDLLTNAPKRVKNAVVKGNTIVVYFHEKEKAGFKRKGRYDGDGDYNTRWYALDLDQKDLNKFQSLLAQSTISWQNVKAPKADGYDRREGHVMIPYGREGMFGGDVAGKVSGKKAEEMLKQDLGIDGDEFLENLDTEAPYNWPREYFLKEGKWKVGAIPQQRTQQHKKSLRPFTRRILNLLSAQGYKDLSKKGQVRFQKLEQHMDEFYQFLISLPASEIIKIQGSLQSYTALQIAKDAYKQVSAREGSSRKTPNPKRVPHLLEKADRFDTMLSELEGANAQSRRSSLRKR